MSLLGHELSLHTLYLALILLLALQILRTLIIAIYNLYFHPLSHIPGPPLWITFPITRALQQVHGTVHYTMVDMHRKYGPVIRVNATDLSFAAESEQTWKEIYGQRGDRENKKTYHAGTGHNGQNILSANKDDHYRFRGAMLPAFTDRSLVLQEPIINSYVDLLVKRLGEVADKGEETNIVKWFEFTTFDLIGDLAYGESFGGLESGKSNEWLDNISRMLRIMPLLALMSVNPLIGSVIRAFKGEKIREALNSHVESSKELARKRISREDSFKGRGDFMDAMMRGRGKKFGLSDQELQDNADLLITAGSETTASLLAGVTYWLLRTPAALDRVTREVRESFEREEEIGFRSASERLPYMLAVLKEGLRIFPPVPLGLQRCTNEVVTVIEGVDVPPRTKISIHQLATFHSPTNFHSPTSFCPERWLPTATTDPSSPFFNDNRDVLKPFSVGPRDCIGRNLAYHEMRIILARMLFNFDLGFGEEETGRKGGWDKQKIFGIWSKPPLMVRVARRRD